MNLFRRLPSSCVLTKLRWLSGRTPVHWAVLFACFTCLTGSRTEAVVHSVTVDGPDAIFLAGRTDLVIPPAASPWSGPGDFLIRHSFPTPEEALESIPPFISVSGGDMVRVLDPAVGGINFFNGFGPPYFGPSGNGLAGSNLTPLGGISGYIGPQGPLAGVFLDDSIPSAGPAPATLDFSPSGMGLEFSSLSPALRQVFYIGDGVKDGRHIPGIRRTGWRDATVLCDS